MSQTRPTNLAIVSIERNVAETITYDAVINDFAAVPRQFAYGHFAYDTSSTDISSTDISSIDISSTTVYQRAHV